MRTSGGVASVLWLPDSRRKPVDEWEGSRRTESTRNEGRKVIKTKEA